MQLLPNFSLALLNIKISNSKIQIPEKLQAPRFRRSIKMISMVDMANEIATVIATMIGTVIVMIVGIVGTATAAGAATMIIQIGVDRSIFDRRH